MSASELPAGSGTVIRPTTEIRPVRKGYRLLTVLVWLLSAGLIGYFVQQTRGAAVPASTQVGRLYGLVGTGLFVFLALYGLRRISYFSRFGKLEFWYRAHLLLGLVALVLLGCHSGFQFRSPFLAALQIGFWGSVGTGIFGWAYQTLIRWWLVRHEYTPAVLSELDARRDRIVSRLYSLAEENSKAGEAFSKQDVDRAVRGMAARRSANLWQMKDWTFWEAQADAAAGEWTSLSREARQLVRDLNQVEVLRSYHRFMRGWTLYHLLLSAVGVQFMLWHIVSVAVNPR